MCVCVCVCVYVCVCVCVCVCERERERQRERERERERDCVIISTIASKRISNNLIDNDNNRNISRNIAAGYLGRLRHLVYLCNESRLGKPIGTCKIYAIQLVVCNLHGPLSLSGCRFVKKATKGERKEEKKKKMKKSIV